MSSSTSEYPVGNGEPAALREPEPAEVEAAKRYFQAVAQARYVIRRVVRIVDEQARREALEPLEHQTLIQVCGAREGRIQVNELAERVDIVPAFASRLVRSLEGKGLVERRRSEQDRRVTLVAVTPKGAAVLDRIDQRVHLHVDVFKEQLTERERAAAFRIFAFYVGMPEGVSAEQGEPAVGA